MGGGSRLRRLAALALLVALAVGLAWVGLGGHEPRVRDTPAALSSSEVAAAELPPEARATLRAIQRGGPFPYRKDGAVFANREQRLPQRPHGYYTEYTVRTPSERDRGPRRIVAGGGAQRDPATSGEYYYTDDHYSSFRRIRE